MEEVPLGGQEEKQEEQEEDQVLAVLGYMGKWQFRIIMITGQSTTSTKQDKLKLIKPI